MQNLCYINAHAHSARNANGIVAAVERIPIDTDNEELQMFLQRLQAQAQWSAVAQW